MGDCGVRIADCGLGIADWGLGIADWGLRIAECGFEEAAMSDNPQSAIRNPQLKWCRVFGSTEEAPEPGEVLAFVNGLVVATGNFGGDEAGWFRAEILCESAPPLEIERFLASEKGLRAELNSWAAWVETHET